MGFGPKMTDFSPVYPVSLKLPTFWTLRPLVRFRQAEAQFQIWQISSDSTRYYHVVSALDQETAAQVADFIQSPPEEGKYEAFKALLIGTFGLSRREPGARLLHLDGLGDRLPSALMNEMLALADGHKPCLMFEQAFLEQLSEDIHLLLADADFSDPWKVADRAGVLWKAKRERVASVSQITRPRAQQQTRPGPAGGHTQHRGRSEEDSEQWCFYHQRWGTEACCCRPPYKGQGQLLLMTMAAGHQDSLLYVWDKQSGHCFLVDTGVKISVLPPTGYDTRNRKPEPTLTAANSSTIWTYSTRTVQLQFSASQFTWDFTQATVAQPLLGADFLRAHSLLVDLQGKRLVHAETFQTFSLGEAKLPAPHLDSHHAVGQRIHQNPGGLSIDSGTAVHGSHAQTRGTAPHPDPGTTPPRLRTKAPPWKSSTWQRRSSKEWRNWGSYRGPTAHGPPPRTWCPKQPGVGDHAATTAD
ncbi:uncharacterized protein LOC132403751 [Hypanus sabinus]|uniref:uncharacterized protein LOC132403751 n=1 Tax=Hypanus sabinus TaxID=79690 RepID=UPI0028C3D929|nr:uncharacterized protein LOC132403751 [Hypanus sabinus]XP_059843393.1 uncharacterized protein LOC132403751 [Hypanus sabinus]